MARGKSEKLTTQLPADYSPNWLDGWDKRTKVWVATQARTEALQADAGGVQNLTHAKNSLISRAVFLELLIETQEYTFASGGVVDVGGYTAALNSLLGIYRVLGVERKARTTKTLQDVLKGGKATS